MSNRTGSNSSAHAVVIGGSVAGLLAAHILTDHFDHVTIVERDRFPEEPLSRKGVPQGHHIHQVLLRGKHILEQLFPGLAAELAAAGAVSIDWGADTRWLSSFGWGTRTASGPHVYSCSRELLEWALRRRVLASARIRCVEQADVIALCAGQAGGGVDGVRVRARGAGSGVAGSDTEIRADLVVDAGGRSSRAPDWLSSLGYAPPPETTITSFLGYASRTYERPAVSEADWMILAIQSRPPHGTKSAVLFPIEGGRCMVTLAGYNRDFPPTDEAGFLEYTRRLPDPILYQFLSGARPLSPIAGYRRTENRLRHYERMRKIPSGFVALGDAVCAFNPVYGQGMTAAAEGALLLDRCLAERARGDDGGFERRFQCQLAQFNRAPWSLATGVDFRFPATEGRRPPLASLTQRYMDELLRLAVEQPDVYRTFLDVMHMVQPPGALFRPRLAARVIGRLWRGDRSSGPAAGYARRSV